jgi:hypothetical protein
LQRNRNIDNITWNGADAAGILLWSTQLPNAVLSSETVVCKANDFAFLSFDAVFEFKLNVNKFMVGSLLVNYEPVPTLSGLNRDMTTLTQMTGYPYCVIDGSTGPSVIFKVPFTYKNVAWEFALDSATPWAQLNVFVLNPLLAAAGPAAATVSVWCRAENIKLSVPVPYKITPYTPAVFNKSTGFVAQMEAKAGAATGSVAVVNKFAKDVQGTLNAGEGILNSVMNAVPWVTDLVTDAASVFGFSKFDDLQTVDPMVQQAAKYMTHHNGIDNSVKLSFDCKNSLAVKNDLFGFKEDQMDIKLVTSNPNFLETFNWSNTDTVGKVLRTWPVSPGFSAPGTLNTNVSPTLMAYIASMFTKWRGGINYKLQVVANSFYSGRIGIAYFPRSTSVSDPIVYDTLDAAVLVVCDVRGSTDCVYEVKWTLPRAWLNVRCASRTSIGSGMTYANINQPDMSLGLVAVFVVNELQAPDTVPSTIPINLWTWGSPDMQFAVPTCPLYVPVPKSLELPNPDNVHHPYLRKKDEQKVVLKKTNSKTSKNIRFEAQMEAAPQNLNTDRGQLPRGHQPIHGKVSTRTDWQHSAATIGEVVKNLRQLTRMFSLIASETIPADQMYQVDPTYFGWDVSTIYNCRLYRIMRLYAYWAGSIRFKFAPIVPNGTSYPVLNVTSDMTAQGSTFSPGPIPQAFDCIGFNWMINVAQTPWIEVELPFYSNNYRAVTTNTSNSTRPICYVYPRYDNTEGTPVDVYCAAGDDFSAGFLKSAPLIQLI